MFALERTLAAVLRYCDCSACFAHAIEPKLSRRRFHGRVAQTHTCQCIMVTLLLYLPYYDVVLQYERHTQFMTLQTLAPCVKPSSDETAETQIQLNYSVFPIELGQLLCTNRKISMSLT